MTAADINRWLGQQESQTLEFKRAADAKSIAETICGMLNAAGGVVVVGVTDEGIVVGLDDADLRAEELEQFIRQRVTPIAPWSLVTSESGGNSVLVIDVPSGSRKPYIFDGRVFVRVGELNRAAVASDISELIQERIKADEHWERQPAVGVTTGDLDSKEIEKTINQAVEAGRFDFAKSQSEKVLQQLNLVIDGRPIHAAVIAFGSHVLPWYPQCTLRMARFRGISKDEFIDQRRVSAHAFQLLEDASAFLSQHIPVRGTFKRDNIQRQDRPLYPLLALREALVNAFCHRDYSIIGGAVSIAIFDNRLEIVSTGTLPVGVKIADLKRDHFSQPRNPLLADLFYRRGLIELWGRGTQGIVRLCVDAGCPEPQFEERAGEFVVRFFAPDYALSLQSGFDLSARQARVLSVLQAGPKQFLREIKERIDPELSDATIRGDLNRLRELGLVESVGVGRGAFWRLVRLTAPSS